MAGARWPPEDVELPHAARAPPTAAADLVSDDDRSVAADSWSIKSEYGSTLDDEQRQADVLSSCNFPAPSDCSSDKDEPDDNEVEPSMLGLQSYWDNAYAEDLANFHEHGHAGEVWFGMEVMDTVASWTKNLCTGMSQHDAGNDAPKELSSWSVLDIGTGNGLLLQELARHGYSDLTGTDYSEGAMDLARSLATRNGFASINFVVDKWILPTLTPHFGVLASQGGADTEIIARLHSMGNVYTCQKEWSKLKVDDILDTKLERQFHLVMDKGTLDAIGLHPEGPVRRLMYLGSVSKLVAPGGLLVITSCNSTRDELVQEVESFNQLRDGEAYGSPVFQYVDHVKTYPTIMFGGVEGSRVATVAFLRR